MLLAVAVAAPLVLGAGVGVADGTTNVPIWVNNLIKHLDGQPITDPEFWTAVQNLITTRLNSQYAANEKINIIITDTVVQGLDSETLEINLKGVRVVGVNTQRDTIDLILEFDLLNTGDAKITIQDMRFTLFGDSRLLAAGSDDTDYTLQPITKRAALAVVVVERPGMTSAEMITWFNQIDIWVMEGAARTGAAEWDEFRSVA